MSCAAGEQCLIPDRTPSSLTATNVAEGVVVVFTAFIWGEVKDSDSDNLLTYSTASVRHALPPRQLAAHDVSNARVRLRGGDGPEAFNALSVGEHEAPAQGPCANDTDLCDLLTDLDISLG